MNVILLPDLRFSSGGPASFQRSIKSYLNHQDILFSHAYSRGSSCCLVINGTNRIDILLKCLFARLPIVVRLGSRHRSNLIYSPGLLASLRYLPRKFSINISLLLCDSVIFQSRIVEQEWSKHPLICTKKTTVIHNPVAPNVPLDPQISESNRIIHLVAFEANHPPAEYSLPFILTNYLNNFGPEKFHLHVIGSTHESWDKLSSYDFLSLYGHMNLDDLSLLLASLCSPIYIPSDNFPCGCPNAFLELQSFGVPSIALQGTPQAELVDEFQGGCIADTSYVKLIEGIFSPLPAIRAALYRVVSNYLTYSVNASKVSCHLTPDIQFSKYIQLLSHDTPLS